MTGENRTGNFVLTPAASMDANAALALGHPAAFIRVKKGLIRGAGNA